MKKYRLVVFMRIDLENEELFNSFSEAYKAKEQEEFLNPENIVEIEEVEE